MSRARLLGMALALTAAVASGWVTAAPIGADISIAGSANFDASNSNASTAGASQSGTLTSIISGATSTSTVNGTTVTGANPLSGSLASTGDGFGLSFLGTGSDLSDEVSGFFGDLFFDLANTSATISYTIRLLVSFDNAVGSSGADAFADIDFRFLDETNSATPIELYFSDLTSDTVNGNQVGGISTGNSGGSEAEAGSTVLTLLLAPGATLNLHGLLNTRGGAFADPSAFSFSFDTLITVDSVIPSTLPPNPVPEPAALALLAVAVAALAISRRRSHHREGVLPC